MPTGPHGAICAELQKPDAVRQDFLRLPDGRPTRSRLVER